MKNSLLLLALTLTAPKAFALPEGDFAKVTDLLENRDGFYSTGSFTGADLAKIAYTKFGSQPGDKGCLVIVPGQGEASLKYIETAYDLSQKGFAPIYVIDNRGQGASDRLLPDPQKSTVRKFDHYQQDLAKLTDLVVLKDAACLGHQLSLLAHSMGGAIAASYLEAQGANSPYHKVALSSPMMKIAYPQGKTENGVILETFFACLAPVIPHLHCDDFAPGKGPYVANKDNFADNAYTHSEARFGLKKELFARYPQLVVGGPTVRWVRQAALGDKAVRRQGNAGRIAASILLLSAGNDTIVDNAGEAEFCRNANSCRLEKIDGANHELLMETDPIRDRALDLIVSFLGSK